MTARPALKGFDFAPFLIPQENGREFQLWEEVTYTAAKGDSWTLPEGFRTDFATIPAVVSWAVAKLGAWTLAALVHDLLCEGLNDWHAYLTDPITVAEKYEHDGVFEIQKPTANAVDTDAIFYRIARDHGVDRVTAGLLWTGVRWGALGNAARREGWLRTAPAVLSLSLLYAPVLVPATVLALLGRLALRAARLVVR